MISQSWTTASTDPQVQTSKRTAIHRPDLGEVVHPGVFEHGCDHEEIAHDDEVIQGCGVRNPGKFTPRVQCQSGEGQEGCNSWKASIVMCVQSL